MLGGELQRCVSLLHINHSLFSCIANPYCIAADKFSVIFLTQVLNIGFVLYMQCLLLISGGTFED